MVSLAVVILNYNGLGFLEKFLPNVETHSPGCQIVVADNASTDGSVAYLEKHHPNVQLVILHENHGYAGGYNEALKQVAAEFYVLLNSDVEVTPGWLDPIVAMMQADDAIAAAQPKILAYDDKSRFEYAGAGGGFIDMFGYPFCRGRVFFAYEQDHGQYNDTVDVFWATGACLFVRAKAFQEMGGFDPDFFAHMEEIDLCWKFNNAGYRVVYNGQSAVYHVGGGTLPPSNPKKTYLNFRNGLAMLIKNYRLQDMWVKLPLRVLLDGVAATKFLLSGGFGDFKAVFKAYGYILGNWNTLMSKRKVHQHKRRTKLPKTIYKHSIVMAHYLLNKKKFSQLEF